jgi:hypothetical protein
MCYNVRPNARVPSGHTHHLATNTLRMTMPNLKLDIKVAHHFCVSVHQVLCQAYMT